MYFNNGIYPIPSDNIPLIPISNKCVVLDLDQTLIATQDEMISLKTLGILTNPKLISLRNRIYHIIIYNSNSSNSNSSNSNNSNSNNSNSNSSNSNSSNSNSSNSNSSNSNNSNSNNSNSNSSNSNSSNSNSSNSNSSNSNSSNSDKVYEYWGIVRPHINEFLLFCFSYFKVVAIWSAGERKYVEEIVAHIFKDLPKPHIIYARENTQISKNSVLKSLDKLFNHNSIFKKYMNTKNTLAIDDNLTTFANNKGNGVGIPAFEPDLTIASMSKEDNTLLKLMYWLLQPQVISCDDVTKLDKSKIFTTSIDLYKKKYIPNPNFKFS